MLQYRTEKGRTDLYNVKRRTGFPKVFHKVIANGRFPGISHKSFSNHKHAITR